MNTAVKRRSVPFAQPLLGSEEEEEVLKVLRSGWLTAGPKVAEFEHDFRNYTGSRHSLALNSGTSALYLSLLSLGIGAGDEVITTPFTFASTANAIVLAGAVPVFSDVDATTFNLDAGQIEEQITPRTRAILVVHFAGRPADLDSLRALATRHGISLIEDATHALGARYKGEVIGGGSTLAAFSFYPTKNITAGEGGMLTTNDAEIARKIRVLRWYGLTEGIWDRHRKDSDLADAGEPEVSDFPEVVTPSHKMNMNDIQAALGVCQLRKLDGFNQIRRSYVLAYRAILRDVPEIILPAADDHEVESSWHLFVLRIDRSRTALTRKDLSQRLAAQGIGTSYHYRSLHLHRFYRDLPRRGTSSLDVATRLSEEVLSLPLYPKMTIDDVEYVAHCVKAAFGRA
jgi:dTDP-4-amino-4,6-dideoxygalactose transaminase